MFHDAVCTVHSDSSSSHHLIIVHCSTYTSCRLKSIELIFVSFFKTVSQYYRLLEDCFLLLSTGEVGLITASNLSMSQSILSVLEQNCRTWENQQCLPAIGCATLFHFNGNLIFRELLPQSETTVVPLS